MNFRCNCGQRYQRDWGWVVCPKCRAELNQKCSECGEPERIGSQVCQKKLTEAREKLDEYVKQNRDKFLSKKWIFFSNFQNCRMTFLVVLFLLCVGIGLLLVLMKKSFFIFLISVIGSTIPMIHFFTKIEMEGRKKGLEAEKKARDEFMEKNPEEAEILKKGLARQNKFSEAEEKCGRYVQEKREEAKKIIGGRTIEIAELLLMKHFLKFFSSIVFLFVLSLYLNFLGIFFIILFPPVFYIVWLATKTRKELDIIGKKARDEWINDHPKEAEILGKGGTL